LEENDMSESLKIANDEKYPFLCIEEPENGLYHKLLESLVREF